MARFSDDMLEEEVENDEGIGGPGEVEKNYDALSYALRCRRLAPQVIDLHDPVRAHQIDQVIQYENVIVVPHFVRLRGEEENE